MAKVRKANRVVNVDKTHIDGYLKRGYDLINDEGEVVKQATGGKTISVATHNKVVEENEELKAKVADLTEKAKEFAEKGKALQEENERLKKQNKK